LKRLLQDEGAVVIGPVASVEAAVAEILMNFMIERLSGTKLWYSQGSTDLRGSGRAPHAIPHHDDHRTASDQGGSGSPSSMPRFESKKLYDPAKAAMPSPRLRAGGKNRLGLRSMPLARQSWCVRPVVWVST
jgi:hypothetical protein